MTEFIWWQLDLIRNFLHAGGPVLWLIIVLSGVIGFLISERYFYLLRIYPHQLDAYMMEWDRLNQTRKDYRRSLRDMIISQAKLKLSQPLPLLKTMIAICPLLGLLGTVTGMVEVFDVIAVQGTSNARAMAAGISRATLPTLAGMVIALPGLYFSLLLDQRVENSVRWLGDQLTLKE